MNIASLLQALETSETAIFIQQSSWAFQAVETVHVLAFSLVVGTIAIVDLRLLGVASQNCAFTEIMRDCLRWTWIAFIVAAIAGFLMFITKASIYFNDLPFRLKMLLLAAAAINMLIFHFGVFRGVKLWDKGYPVPIAAKIAGAISLSLWVGVIVFGRWVGFSIEESLPTL
jgi:hypothetical protein